MENNILLRIKILGSEDIAQAQQSLQTITNFVNKYNKTIKEYELAEQAGVTQSKAKTDAYNKAIQILPTLINEQEKLTTVVNQNSQAILNNSITTKELNRTKTLEAKTVNETIGAYQRLLAQYDLAQKEMFDLAAAGDMTSETFLSAQANYNKYGSEVARINGLLNKSASGMNNMYNSTFQMTQIVRELPNFAMDARIGFMSLSNNLPMLADGFKQLANQIDTVTGKRMGWGYAFKQMGLSLISLNTLIIAATTLLVMYGDKIVDLIKGMDTSGLKEFHDELKKGQGVLADAEKNVMQTEAAVSAYKEGVITAEDFTKKMNAAVGDSVGKFNDATEAMNWYTNNTDAYISAMAHQAKANSLLQDAVNLRTKAIDKADNKEVSGIAIAGEKFAIMWEGIFNKNETQMKTYEKMEDAKNRILERRLKKSDKLNNEATQKGKIFQEEQKKAWEELEKISKKDDINTDKKNKKTISTTKTVKEAADSYNYLAEALKSVNDELLTMSEEDEYLGQKNPYDKRVKALERWYENEKSILDEDVNLRIKNGDDITKIENDYNNSLYELNKKKAGILNKIDKDYIKDKLTLYKNNLDDVKRVLEDEQQAEIEAENKRYQTILLSKKTNKEKELETKNHNIRLLEINSTYQERILQSEIDSLKLSLDTLKLSDSDKEAQLKLIQEKELNLRKIHNDNINKLEEQKATQSTKAFQITEQDKQDILSSSLDAMRLLWDSYYSYISDKNDAELDKQLDAFDARKEADIAALDKQKEYGIISETSYNNQKDAIDAAYKKKEDEAKRKAFEQDKKLKIKQALMEMALGIARIWAQSGINVLVGGIMTGLLTLTTGAQIAAISKQQYAGGGKVIGQNIPMMSNGDNVVATLKTGEVVLNERQQAALGGASTFRRIGVPGFSSGGVVSYSSPKIPDTNYSGLKSYIDNKINNLRVILVESDIYQASKRTETKTLQTQLL